MDNTGTHDDRNLIKLLENAAATKRLQAEARELKKIVFDELGHEPQTVTVEGHGSVAVLKSRKSTSLNVLQALANVLDVKLLKADRKAQIAQLTEALGNQGHKAPQKTTKTSASLQVRPNG